jgi:hypothetical protein
MSTRGIIARTTGPKGQFAGRYHHSDSYPTGLGAELWKLYHGHFRRDLKKMLQLLLDKHTSWSMIVHKDFSLLPGYTWEKAVEQASGFQNYSKLPDYRRPQCHCHGSRREKGFLFTHDTFANGEDGSAEWLYVFDEEQKKLFVRDLNHNKDLEPIALSGPEPDWTKVECGENFERCRHYAWFHGLLPKTSNLSTQTWLERRPLEFRDAIAVIVSGRRYRMTGSGGDASYMRRQHPAGTWVSSVIAGNGRRLEIPTAVRTSDGFKPAPGVVWVYPPTKSNPNESEVRG